MESSLYQCIIALILLLSYLDKERKRKMSDVNNQAIDILVKQMMTIANNEVSNASFSKEYTGIVEEVLGNKKYKIRYNNASYIFTTKNVLNIRPYSTVHIIVPNNNITQRYILEDLIASYSSGGNTGGTSGEVTSVDGMTGDVVLSGIYAKKSNVYTKKEINDNYYDKDYIDSLDIGSNIESLTIDELDAILT